MPLPLHRQKPLHFIGVGGAGMSAAAMVLADRGFIVTGSDSTDKQTLQLLRRKGIRVFKYQNSSTIKAINGSTYDKPIVITSTAVSELNAELVAARRAGLEVFHRSDVLAALINRQLSIAVAGSHGKTTTSTLIATFLSNSNHDPTAIIGGILPAIGCNGYGGMGNLLVAEVDESDGSLVKFRASLGIITNLELDHTNHYAKFRDLITTMQYFASGCSRLLANRDCPVLRDYFTAQEWWSNEIYEGVKFAGIPVSLKGDHTLVDFYEDGELMCRFELPLPGLHNLSNITAAVASCRLQGLNLDRLTINLVKLKPPSRRFDYCGTWKSRIIVDDYAHHPSEVKATLGMARLMVQSHSGPLPQSPLRLIAVFQPHRYTRTAEFLESFAMALVNADQILIAPIYSAGEKPIPGISNATLASVIERIRPDLITLVANNYTQLIQQMESFTQPGDLILMMGAGDMNNRCKQLLKLC
uniref:UDP-N-acetylmuramate--L-alanine ligase n=1 Tax=Paulinella chromatophora TaxID=39717 RepID=B1X4I8_PAUCH|nr:UDP-N-acetylmuramate--alanine ligase [Paulinella chromatophora]ACB42857.1 UDP-N-acetylmuramate--alanine ligase [Paulinella chromatophora]